jgi:hypothetical protein
VETQRVILAGIGEERLDLFLLLNAGAGYRVVGVLDEDGDGESARIAEILGVKVYGSAAAHALPKADVLIYGHERYRPLGAELSIEPSRVWHENHAWSVLAESEARSSDVEDDADIEDDEDDAEAPSVPHMPSQRETVTINEHVTVGTEGVTTDDDITVGPESGRSRPSLEDEFGGSDYVTEVATASATDTMASRDPVRELPRSRPPREPRGVGETPRSGATTPDPRPVGATATASPEREGLAPRGDYKLLHDVLSALEVPGALNHWLLDRALALSGAAAGGIVPLDPVRAAVWRDRRQGAAARMPEFLRGEVEYPSRTAIDLGHEGDGAARLVLIRAAETAELEALVAALEPAFAVMAERDDLLRAARAQELAHALAGTLGPDVELRDALADAARRLAHILGAEECAVLLRSSDRVLSGVTSNGEVMSIPVQSTMIGVGSGPSRLLDERGRWHYHVPFGEGDRRGILAAYGVDAPLGAADAVAHEVSNLARLLADRIPATAWEG